jgi:hypothetical protein
MHGIHDVFPEHENDTTNPIAKNKLFKGEGQMSTTKTLLGFNFNSKEKTMWLETAKRDQLLTILHSWIRAVCKGYHLKNLNWFWQKYDMHLQLCQLE